jgi:hypothetical protein
LAILSLLQIRPGTGEQGISGCAAGYRIFLRKLENVDLRGKKGFAFDTRLKSRFAGSAANGIEKKLRELGLTIIRDYASVIVAGTEGRSRRTRRRDSSKSEAKSRNRQTTVDYSL